MTGNDDDGPTMPNGSVTQHDVEYGDTNGQHVQSHQAVNMSRYFEILAPLRDAAMKGDWQAATKLIERDPRLCIQPITLMGETVLHVAAGAGKTDFIKNLLDFNDIVLELPDKKGNTAFCVAVAAGEKAIAEMMLNKNPNLLTKSGVEDAKPLYYATLFGRGQIAIFLYNKMKDRRVELPVKEQERIFFACLNAHLYDVALILLDDNPELAKARCEETEDTALHFLARHPSVFRSTTGVGILSGLMNRNKSRQTIGFKLAKRLWDIMKSDDNVRAMIRRPEHLLFDAVVKGNFPLVEMMIHSYPDLAWEQNEQLHTIFHAAIKHRRADIFYLIYDIGSIKNVINGEVDDKDNNMLHLVAMPPNKSRLDLIPGAAFQMQQELLWYKEVKKVMEPWPSDRINSDGYTPKELFIAKHENLLKDGEEWMKKTAGSCTFVATLISIVAFATAFIMPGGSDQNKGTAVFLNDKTSELNFLKQNPFIFSMFAISASVALAASTTSILCFLAILISPYSQKEFLNSLPFKLVIGFFMLFISMIGMMFTFCIAFMLAYAEKSKSIPWVIVFINIVPIFIFVVLLGPLFWNVCCSTHIRRLLCRQRKLKLY